MAKTQEPRFKIGQEVYMIADPEQIKRQVARIVITQNGYEYSLRIEGVFVEVFDTELTEEKNLI